MVMDLLGPSLKNNFESCGRKFDLKTVLMLADQLVQTPLIIRSNGTISSKHFLQWPTEKLTAAALSCRHHCMAYHALSELFQSQRVQVGFQQIHILLQITCLEYVHSKGFTHGSVKPDNFVMGIGEQADKVQMLLTI